MSSRATISLVSGFRNGHDFAATTRPGANPKNSAPDGLIGTAVALAVANAGWALHTNPGARYYVDVER